MSLPVPSASNGYAITADHVNNHVLWSAVLGELHSRLQAAEAALADYEAAVSVEALAIAQGAVDDTIGPQIATLQDTIAALNLSIAAAEDQLAALQSGGVAAANVPVSSYGIIPGGSNADQAFAILVDAIAATADARAAIVAAIPGLATQAEARAGTNNTKFASPLRVREARLMRSNVQSTAYTAAAADFGLEITCSSTWTLGLTAAATLGDGWYCYVRNIGSGVITIDPNGSETIDGATTLALKPGAVLMIHCDGATFRTFGRENGFGVAQTWQLPSRSAATSYQNTTSKPIYVVISFPSTAGIEFQISTDNSTWTTIARCTSVNSVVSSISAIIPVNIYYRYTTSSANHNTWAELR